MPAAPLTPSYPRPYPVIPAPLPRHTRARRGYLAEFCTQAPQPLPDLTLAAALSLWGAEGRAAVGEGRPGRGLVLGAARYPRRARV